MDSTHLKSKFNVFDNDMYAQYDYHLGGAKEDPEEILRQALRSSYSRRTSVSIILILFRTIQSNLLLYKLLLLTK